PPAERFTGPLAIEDGDEERRACGKEGDNPRGELLLHPDDRDIAQQDEAGADLGGGDPLARTGGGNAAPAGAEEGGGAGECEARAGQEERRQRLDGDANAEVGGTPDEIERQERGRDRACSPSYGCAPLGGAITRCARHGSSS